MFLLFAAWSLSSSSVDDVSTSETVFSVKKRPTIDQLFITDATRTGTMNERMRLTRRTEDEGTLFKSSTSSEENEPKKNPFGMFQKETEDDTPRRLWKSDIKKEDDEKPTRRFRFTDEETEKKFEVPKKEEVSERTSPFGMYKKPDTDTVGLRKRFKREIDTEDEKFTPNKPSFPISRKDTEDEEKPSKFDFGNLRKKEDIDQRRLDEKDKEDEPVGFFRKRRFSRYDDETESHSGVFRNREEGQFEKRPRIDGNIWDRRHVEVQPTLEPATANPEETPKRVGFDTRDENETATFRRRTSPVWERKEGTGRGDVQIEEDFPNDKSDEHVPNRNATKVESERKELPSFGFGGRQEVKDEEITVVNERVNHSIRNEKESQGMVNGTEVSGTESNATERAEEKIEVPVNVSEGQQKVVIGENNGTVEERQKNVSVTEKESRREEETEKKESEDEKPGMVAHNATKIVNATEPETQPERKDKEEEVTKVGADKPGNGKEEEEAKEGEEAAKKTGVARKDGDQETKNDREEARKKDDEEERPRAGKEEVEKTRDENEVTKKPDEEKPQTDREETAKKEEEATKKDEKPQTDKEEVTKKEEETTKKEEEVTKKEEEDAKKEEEKSKDDKEETTKKEEEVAKKEEKPQTDKEEVTKKEEEVTKKAEEKPKDEKEDTKNEEEKPQTDKEEVMKKEEEKPKDEKEDTKKEEEVIKKEEEKPQTDKEEAKKEEEVTKKEEEKPKDEKEDTKKEEEVTKKEEEKPQTDKEESKKEEEKHTEKPEESDSHDQTPTSSNSDKPKQKETEAETHSPGEQQRQPDAERKDSPKAQDSERKDDQRINENIQPRKDHHFKNDDFDSRPRTSGGVSVVMTGIVFIAMVVALLIGVTTYFKRTSSQDDRDEDPLLKEDSFY